MIVLRKFQQPLKKLHMVPSLQKELIFTNRKPFKFIRGIKFSTVTTFLSMKIERL